MCAPTLAQKSDLIIKRRMRFDIEQGGRNMLPCGFACTNWRFGPDQRGSGTNEENSHRRQNFVCHAHC